ncbi:MAG: N-acetylglucosamine-6-phosphate deacetylase [Anaerolineaceae bacterium]|nr:N-acetylglucosamine-6-phosphate deacetylase [Anaerolineaceae bacterium]
MIIKTSNLYTPYHQEGDRWLKIEDGLIKGISETPFDTEESVIDLSPYTLTPGWIEVQINGAYGFDFTDDPANIWEVAEKLAQLGFTTCLPTVITSPKETIEKALNTWQGGPPEGYLGCQVPGLHLEGPFLNPLKKGAHRLDRIISPDFDFISNWNKKNGVQLVTLAPELPGALDIVQELKERGVVVSAGHSMASGSQAKTAFDAGISFGTHLYNAMPPLGHRDPGLTGALLTTDAIPVGLIVDGIHSAPEMVNLAWRCKGERGIVLVTDAMAALGKPAGTYQLGGSAVTVTELDARLADGTLAGSILTPLEAIHLLMVYTGCSFEQALYGWTINPATLMGYTDRGYLAVDTAADLVVLDQFESIQAVIIRGQLVYQSMDFSLKQK